MLTKEKLVEKISFDLDSVNPVFQYKKYKAKNKMLEDYDTLLDIRNLENEIFNNRRLGDNNEYKNRYKSSKENYNKALENYNKYLKNNRVLAITKNDNGSHKIVEIDNNSAGDINKMVDVFQKNASIDKKAGVLNHLNPFWLYNRAQARNDMLEAYDAYDRFTQIGNMTTLNSMGHDESRIAEQLKLKELELRENFENKKKDYDKFLEGNRVFAIISNKRGEKKIIERPQGEFNDNKSYIKNIIKAKYMQELMNNDLLKGNY